jgi:RimK family alpha-L-glutamate ligase
MRIALVSPAPGSTDRELASVRVHGLEVVMLRPAEAASTLVPGDVALGRFDVRPTLDGVEEGLWALGVLAARGVVVLNGPGTLLATHDKLLTTHVLRRARLPHPDTRHVRGDRTYDALPAPAVLKPRHGSWGSGVTLCETDAALDAALRRVRRQPWYAQHGVLVQELVPPTGSDLRLVVAAGRVVGAVRRVAAEGEWRTNVALGATRSPVDPPLAAAHLAREAAKAVGAALVGVDLLETPDGGFTILELNGAVEFTREYRLVGDVFREAVTELERLARGVPQGASATPALHLS